MNGKIKALRDRAARAASGTASVNGAERQFATAAEAVRFFAAVKEKLLRLENWQANAVVNNYEIYDANGEICESKILTENAFLCISMPGTGKNDWVRIVAIDDAAPDEFIITLRPSRDPTERSTEPGETSHFFVAAASNNFCLQTTDATVSLEVIGLDERENTADTKNVIESARNFAVANLGSYFGVQTHEWATFCENFLKKGEIGEDGRQKSEDRK